MSRSEQEQIENLELALSLVLRAVGSNPIRQYLLRPDNANYKDIHQTTWLDLRELGYLKAAAIGNFCVLSPSGWVAALERTGTIADPTFKDGLGKLCRYLKDTVKGRYQPALVYVNVIANAIGLPDGIISNIIDAKLIELWLGRTGVDWASGFETKMIAVPITFGSKKGPPRPPTSSATTMSHRSDAR